MSKKGRKCPKTVQNFLQIWGLRSDFGFPKVKFCKQTMSLFPLGLLPPFTVILCPLLCHIWPCVQELEPLPISRCGAILWSSKVFKLHDCWKQSITWSTGWLHSLLNFPNAPSWVQHLAYAQHHLREKFRFKGGKLAENPRKIGPIFAQNGQKMSKFSENRQKWCLFQKQPKNVKTYV